MKEPLVPPNEEERMELIHQLHILDSEAEEIYDGITYIASVVCGMSISTITIVDHHRQWFKSIVGGIGKEYPRVYSFCAHAILGNEILEVPDSLQDERFKDNPLVINEPFVRSYVGAPLELKGGLRIGTLCVMDHKPKKLTEEQLKILHFLSLQVVKLLELRLKVKEIETFRENDAALVNMLTHELRNPLSSISGYLSLTTKFKEEDRNPKYDFIIERCSKNVDRMLRIMNEFLNYAHWKDVFWTLQKKKCNLNNCLKDSVQLIEGYLEICKVHIELQLDERIPEFLFDYESILNVLENLISNAAKYSPEGGTVVVKSELFEKNVIVQVIDRGDGIPENDRDKLFKPFALFNQKNRVGIKGSGIGLSVAKLIIDRHGGQIGFDSKKNQGTTFYFSLPILMS